MVLHREGEEPKPMMHGHEKSDLVIEPRCERQKRKNSPPAEALRGRSQRCRWSEGRGPRGIRCRKARTGHPDENQARVSAQALEAGSRIRQRWFAVPHTRGRSRMRESRTYGFLGGGRAMKRTSLVRCGLLSK